MGRMYRLWCFSVVFALITPLMLSAQLPGPGIITTIAGNGSNTESGDGGPATSAGLALSNPFFNAMTSDRNGDLYISDNQDNIVRTVNASTGIISVVAGNGYAYGPAANSALAYPLRNPGSIALDGAGNLYIVAGQDVGDSAYADCSIYKVVLSTGAISVVSNPCPTIIAADTAGNIYYAINNFPTKPYKSYLYEIPAGSSTSTYIATTLQDVGALAAGGPGVLYASDTQQCEIYQINVSTGALTGIAGNGQCSSPAGDGGPATSAPIGASYGITLDNANHLLLSEENSVRQVDLSSGVITTIIGSSSSSYGFSGDNGPAANATFDAVYSLAVDGQGNVYLEDYGNSRIRVVGATASRPVITKLSPGQGAIGNVVTITGSGFGAQQGSSTISFGGVSATPSSWSNTSIVVPVPQNAVTGLVLVTVNGLTETQAPTFVVLQIPQISSVSPAEGGPGGMVTITGSSFGPQQGTSTVDFEGQPAPEITNVNWGDSLITFMIPQAQVNYAINGLITVVNAAGSSNAAAFTILPSGPGISSILPDPGSIGTQVTIYGSNFGSAQGQSTISFAGTQATPTSWSPNAIVVTVPQGAATGNVVITVAGNASNGFLYLLSGSCSPAS